MGPDVETFIRLANLMADNLQDATTTTGEPTHG